MDKVSADIKASSDKADKKAEKADLKEAIAKAEEKADKAKDKASEAAAKKWFCLLIKNILTKLTIYLSMLQDKE